MNFIAIRYIQCIFINKGRIIPQYYQIFSKGKIYHSKEFVKLMKNCSTYSDDYLFYCIFNCLQVNLKNILLL